jgi:tetratricopeptide (TPR) repeat protein
MQISIAESKFALGNYSEALLEINKEVEMAPDLKESGKENYFNVRGNIFLALAKYNEALSDFEKCVQINPSFALAYVN